MIDVIKIVSFTLMKVVKSRAFKDRLKGHKESVISLFSPYGEQGHMLYSISRDRSVRGLHLIIKVGISQRDKSPSRLSLTRSSRESRRNKRRLFLRWRARRKRKYNFFNVVRRR